MSRPFDISRTLDELDPPPWGEPTYGSSLVTTCHRLRKKPIGQFSVEDLRILVGQEVGLQWLVPLALDTLEREPLVSGDFYPGDLLASVLRIDSACWRREPEWTERVHRILAGLSQTPKELDDAVAMFRQSTV
jgi:hypothetical protein